MTSVAAGPLKIGALVRGRAGSLAFWQEAARELGVGYADLSEMLYADYSVAIRAKRRATPAPAK